MIGFSFSELIMVIPELYLISVALIVLLVAIFTNETANNGYSVSFLKGYDIAILTIALTLVLVVSVRFVSFRAFNDMVISSFAINIFKAAILFFSLLTMVFSRSYMMSSSVRNYEMTIVALFAILGMMLVINANNLLSLYVSLEIQAISLYILIASNKTNKLSNEASIKYFVMSALGTALFLFGASFIYGATGYTGFNDIKTALAYGNFSNQLLILGLVFTIASLAFKLSLAPFHMWAPDVYQGTSSPVVSLIAVPAKIAFVYVTVNFTFVVFNQVFSQISIFIQGLGVASILVGSIAAINQINLKRLIAYSSVANIGYLALLIGSVKDTMHIDTVYFYIIVYALTTLLFISLTMNIKRNGSYIVNITDLKGLASKKPLLSFAIAVIMLSFAGIPPLAGFFGKFFVFYRLVELGQVELALFGVIMSVVSCFYYLRIVKIVYFEEDKESRFTTVFSRYVSFIFYLLIALLVGFIAFISPLLTVIVKDFY